MEDGKRWFSTAARGKTFLTREDLQDWLFSKRNSYVRAKRPAHHLSKCRLVLDASGRC
mgnify:CR=1 FL=1